MKIAICGAGITGTFLANDLEKAGHNILVIEKNPEVVSKNKGFVQNATWITADACEVSSLQNAKLDECDVVVAVTGEDEDNLVISLLAKQEFAVPRVVARINHPENCWLFNESWNVDIAISMPHLLSAVVEEAVNVGTLVKLLQFENDNMRLAEVRLAPSSNACHKQIKELGLSRDAAIVAVIRTGRLVMPREEVVLLPGDEVLVLLHAEYEDTVQKILNG